MDAAQSTTKPFPLRYLLANAAVLFVACFIWGNGPQALSTVGLVAAMLMAATSAFIAGFLVLFSLACQGSVYLLLKNRLRHNVVWGVLFLLPGAAAIAFVTYGSIPSVQTRRILSEAQLAQLPKTARCIRVCSMPKIRGIAGDFLMFEADQADIESFLSASPILTGREARRYSSAGMRLAHRNGSTPNEEQPEMGHEYFTPSPYVPKWYHQEITGQGRRYEFQPMESECYGELVFSEETNTVFIHLFLD
jgi:hypothetical protein